MNKAFKTNLKVLCLIPVSKTSIAVTSVPVKLGKIAYKCSDCKDNHSRCYCLAS